MTLTELYSFTSKRCAILMSIVSFLWLDSVLCIDSNHLMYNNYQPQQPLNCFSCYKTRDGEECIYMDEQFTNILDERCTLQQPHCKVEWYRRDGVFVTFERGCSDDCVPGCQRVAWFETCTHCCTDSLCNTISFSTRSCSSYSAMLLCFVMAYLMT